MYIYIPKIEQIKTEKSLSIPSRKTASIFKTKISKFGLMDGWRGDRFSVLRPLVRVLVIVQLLMLAMDDNSGRIIMK